MLHSKLDCLNNGSEFDRVKTKVTLRAMFHNILDEFEETCAELRVGLGVVLDHE